MSTIKLTATGGGGGTVSLKAPTATQSNGAVELTLPTDDGSADQYLKTNGSGVLSFGTVQDTLSHRNLIINGAMICSQRGTSGTSLGYPSLDRWRCGWSGHDENQTVAQVALTSSDTGPWAKGFRHCLQMTNGNQSSGAGTTDQSYIEQRIEAQNIATSGWDYTSSSSYLTLSFWVKSSVAQTFYFTINMWDGTSQLYVGSYTLSANTWTKITKQIPGKSGLQVDNNNDKAMSVTFWQYYGTNNTDNSRSLDWAAFGNPYTPDQTSTWWTTNDATFSLTGVQLEVGDTATEFEHRSYGDELARCQRYFWMVADGSLYTTKTIGVGFVFSSSSVKVAVHYPVTMRTEPALYQVTDTNAYQVLQPGPTFDYPDEIASFAGRINMGEFELNDDVSGLTAGQACMVRGNSSGMRLGLDAEY